MKGPSSHLSELETSDRNYLSGGPTGCNYSSQSGEAFVSVALKSFGGLGKNRKCPFKGRSKRLGICIDNESGPRKSSEAASSRSNADHRSSEGGAKGDHYKTLVRKQIVDTYPPTKYCLPLARTRIE